jgi:pyrroline-5-carboxylate reductase
MTRIAFVGGGNMAAAMIGGLRRASAADAISVIEVDAQRCETLQRQYQVRASASPPPDLSVAELVVLAVKPQQMRAACLAIRPHLGSPLILSVAAGIRARDIVRWLGTERIVRAMPNTPALIGRGATGAVALPAVGEQPRQLAERILRAVGDVVWLDDERLLDAVTAVSGSGPAYVFHFIDAVVQAGVELGLSPGQARRLAVQTFAGAAALASESDEPLALLRERVTSRGGTTAAALAALEHDGVAAAIARAVRAAHRRAIELGDEFGGS